MALKTQMLIEHHNDDSKHVRTAQLHLIIYTYGPAYYSIALADILVLSACQYPNTGDNRQKNINPSSIT